MKSLFVVLILNVMFISAMSQNYVYNSKGNKKPFETEDIDLLFAKSSIKFSPQEEQQTRLFPLIAIIPTVVDLVFQLTNSSLKNRVKKFTAEYSKQKSYLEAGDSVVPDFLFYRKINNKDQALEISFKAETISGLKPRGIIYYVDYIELNFSAAKSIISNGKFDYSIELKPTFLVSGEKRVQELPPIAISSVKFGKTTFEKFKHRTNLILLPDGAVFVDLSVKIIESNPEKVRAEKILSIWNDNKESAKTIINNFLPK